MTEINIKEVLSQGLKCYAAAPFLSAVHTFLTLLVFGLFFSLGSGILIVFIFHLPFAVYAGFHTASRAYYSGEKVTFKTYWEGYKLRKNVRRFSRRIFLFFVLLFIVVIAAIFGVFNDMPDFFLKGPIPIAIFCALMAAGILYQIALPNAAFIEGIRGKEAYARSRESMFQQIGPAALLFLILFLINILGVAFLGLGIFFTIPFTAYCRQYLWETQAGSLIHVSLEKRIDEIGKKDMEEDYRG